jgi:TRAP-type C4-dicarboxylate transport system permease small subunit
MGGRSGLDGQGVEVDVLYARANERVAKAVAFLGTYLIWVALGVFACGLTFISL